VIACGSSTVGGYVGVLLMRTVLDFTLSIGLAFVLEVLCSFPIWALSNSEPQNLIPQMLQSPEECKPLKLTTII